MDPIAIDPVGPEGEGILANLFQLYAHDMAEWFRLDIGDDGRYRHDLLRHWQNRDPIYFARVGRVLAGFAIVGSGEQWIGDPGAHDIAEFFVLRRHRRGGVGRAMARAVWDRHPGRWLVRVLAANGGALDFWKTTIAAYTGGRYEERQVVPDGKTRVLFTLESVGG